MFVPIAVNLGKMPKVPNGRQMMPGGTQIFVWDGKKHRENGPAEYNSRTGYQAWFQHGLRHRKGGPAVTHPDGSKEYWEKGKLIRKEGK